MTHRSLRSSMGPLFVVAVVLTGAPILPPQTAGSDALAGKVDAVTSEVYKRGESGAAVLVRKDGKIALRKGYGMADLELGVPIAPDWPPSGARTSR